MKKWEVYMGGTRENRCIYGETLAQAAEEMALYLAQLSKPDSEQILSVKKSEIEWSDGILGGKGGVKAKISCRCSTAHTQDSPNYKEFDKIYDAWIIAEKSDI